MASDSAVSTKALYKGSCHCGFVTYNVQLDFANSTPAMHGAVATKCNCSICHKSGYVLADPGSEDSFTLLSPPEGEPGLSDYTFHSHRVHHPFCPRCGIRCYIKGVFVYEGQEFHFMRINLLTLDGRVDGKPMDDLRLIKIKYWNAGRCEQPKAPADDPWEGGVR